MNDFWIQAESVYLEALRKTGRPAPFLIIRHGEMAKKVTNPHTRKGAPEIQSLRIVLRGFLANTFAELLYFRRTFFLGIPILHNLN